MHDESETKLSAPKRYSARKATARRNQICNHHSIQVWWGGIPTKCIDGEFKLYHLTSRCSSSSNRHHNRRLPKTVSFIEDKVLDVLLKLKPSKSLETADPQPRFLIELAIILVDKLAALF